MISSPTAKIEFISKFLNNTLLSTEGSYFQLQEADWVVNLMIISFLSLGGKKTGELYVEIQYIKTFSQEDLYFKHDACQCLTQMETAMERVM